MATHKPVLVDELFGDLIVSDGTNKWHAIHTKPQCEKKLAQYLRQNQNHYYLPQMDSIRHYQYRKVTFTKPMFPGYIFACFNPQDKASILISGYIVNFVKVPNESELIDELKQIYEGKARKADFRQSKWLQQGWKVQIVSGPFMGLTGIVQSQDKLSEVTLQVEILHQAVSMSVNPDDIKVLTQISYRQ